MGAPAEPAHNHPGRGEAHSVDGPAAELGMVVCGDSCFAVDHAVRLRLVHEEQTGIRRPALASRALSAKSRHDQDLIRARAE